MAKRRRRSLRLVDPSHVRGTDELLRTVASGLRRDREQLRSLVAKARPSVGASVRRELDPLAAAPTERGRDGPSRSVAVPTATGARPGRGDRRIRAAIGHNGRSIDVLAATQRKLAATQRKLAATQRRMAELLAQLQGRGDVPLQRVLLDEGHRQRKGLQHLKRRQRTGERSLREIVARRARVLESRLVLQRRDADAQKLHTASSVLHSSAFGRLADPMHPHNLTIVGNHLLWSFLGDIARSLNIDALRTGLLPWLLPVGNLATGLVLLGNRQHSRFVSGIATSFVPVDGSTAVATISLRDRVQPQHWPAFRQRTDIVAAVTAIQVPELAALSAQVVGGALSITVRVEDPAATPSFVDTQVAWMVDADPEDGT